MTFDRTCSGCGRTIKLRHHEPGAVYCSRACIEVENERLVREARERGELLPASDIKPEVPGEAQHLLERLLESARKLAPKESARDRAQRIAGLQVVEGDGK